MSQGQPNCLVPVDPMHFGGCQLAAAVQLSRLALAQIDFCAHTRQECLFGVDTSFAQAPATMQSGSVLRYVQTICIVNCVEETTQGIDGWKNSVHHACICVC